MLSSSVQLICLPFAGAGPSFFYGWRGLGFTGLDIAPVPMPGRERLIYEKPFTNLHVAADSLLPYVDRLSKTKPSVLFGHCFLGSVLAYELAIRLLRKDPNSIRHLFISASRSPFIQRQFNIENIEDENFVDFVKATTGYQHPAFNVPEISELLVPTLRADFMMDETYKPQGRNKISVPITAIVPSNDQFVSRDEISEWSTLTEEEFRMVDLPGSHMYLADDASPLLSIISKTMNDAGSQI